MVDRKKEEQSSLNKNNFKESKGFKSAGQDALESNPFAPTSIRTPDTGKTFRKERLNQNRSFGRTNSNNIVPENNQIQSIVFADVRNESETDQFLNRQSSSDNVLDVVNNSISVENTGDTTIQTTQDQEETNTQKEVLTSFGFNPLDEFENPTYNFKLMLSPENIILEQEILDRSNIKVIAESGKSSNFYIGDVDIENIVGPNNRTKNTQATLFNMEIIEPLGISFFDQLLAAGKELGLKSVTNAPMLLELTFRGYTESGESVEIPNVSKIWKVNLLDISTSLDEGGSRYSLSFSVESDDGFKRNSSASIFKEQINIPVSTVGDFFDDLGYFLTIQDSVLASNGQLTRNEYEFFVEPELRDWVVGQNPNEPNAPSMFVDENEKVSIVIEPGKKLEEIVDAVLSTTEEIEEKANPRSSPEKMDKPQGTIPSQIALISSDVEYLGFNQQNNEYIRKFKYFITLYDAWRALPEKPDNINQKERINALKENALKRKYSYYFTGINTEILDLDIDLDVLWRHATSYYTQAMHRARNNNSNFLVDDNREKDDPDDLRENVEAKKVQTDQSRRKSSLKNNNDIRNENETDDFIGPQLDQQTIARRRLERLRDSGRRDNEALRQRIRELDETRNVVPVQNAVNGGIGTIGDQSSERVGGQLSAQSPEANRNAPTPRLQAERQQASRAGSSLSPSQLIEETNFRDDSQDILQFFIRQTDPALDNSTVQKNIEQTTKYNRSIFGIITNQMYGKQYTNLQEVKLTIRGDPFWLGENLIKRNRRLRDFSIRDTQEDNGANYLNGEKSFLLTFKTPSEYDENTGFLNIDNQTIFKGIYNVTIVKSNFSGGKFTQEINAYRDLNTDATKVE